MEASEQLFWKYHRYQREDDGWDYKANLSLTTKREVAEIAKDILAFSNYGGGVILLGIDDKSHKLVGVQSEVDPANLGDTLEKRLGLNLPTRIGYFNYKRNRMITRLGVMYVPPSDDVLVPARDLHSEDGELIVQEGSIYYRRNTRSVRASTENIRTIIKRIISGETSNDLSLSDEPSALLHLQREHPSEAQNLWEVLQDKYEPTAYDVGKKLREVWKFQTKHSKHEFARFVQIPPSKIDDYFEGRKMLDLVQLIMVTKAFKLERDYFFRPTLNFRSPFWQEDLVKYAILFLTKPKAAISKIDNNGEFYSELLGQFARKICDFHETLFSESYAKLVLEEEKPKVSEKLRKDLSHQYYKILEQYPFDYKDRRLTRAETILRQWFFSSGDYIARLIIEGIQSIDVRGPKNFKVRYRFEEDMKNGVVRFRGYDSTNLRMHVRGS